MATVYAWPGTATGAANSYDTVANATTYFSGRLGADAWTDLTVSGENTLNQALITATRMIDRQRWAGTIVDYDYSDLAWPRSGVTDKYGNSVASDSIPDDLMTGFYELALALLEDEAVQDAVAGGSNTRRVKAGQVEVEFFRPTLGAVGRFPNIVQELLAQFLAGAGSSAAGIVSGDDRQSYFDVVVSDDPDLAIDNTFGVLDVYP